MIIKSPSTEKSSRARTGATLVEVLMALLIMAIGVTSVFTLFPLAILRAIKANQLTNAKLYEGSIKDTLLGNTQLWTGAPAWSENAAYCWPDDNSLSPPFYSSQAPFPSRWVAPKPSNRLLPESNVLFLGPANPGPSPLFSGAHEPGLVKLAEGLRSWVPNQNNPSMNSNVGGYQNPWPAPPMVNTLNEGALLWTAYKHSQDISRPTWSAYVVDPLGWYEALTPTDQRQFGRIISSDSASANLVLDRIHCQLSRDTARELFRLRDSWSEAVETTPVTVVSSGPRIQILFPETMDVTNQGNLNRVVLTSTQSPLALEIPITNPSNPIVPGYSALEIDGNLAGFVADQARIDVLSPSRYSWLMAVHSSPRGEFEAQCAIVFNRTFQALDEQGYRAEFWSTTTANMAKVRWIYNADSESPQIKEGGFIFDANHGYWYQIQKIEVSEERVNADDSLNPAGLYSRSIIRLNDPVAVPTGDPSTPATLSDYRLIDNTNDAQAVIIPGIIRVFPFAP